MDQNQPIGQPNRLQSMNNMLQGSGNPQARPQDWFINGGMKKVSIPADEGGGKWFCSALLKARVITFKEYLVLTNAHAKAILCHGDFVLWYARNCGKIRAEAERQNFDWKSLRPLVDRLRSAHETQGYEACFEVYIHLCATMDNLFGRAAHAEPFQESFYYSSKKDRAKATLSFLFSRAFWRQVPVFLKSRARLRNQEA